MMNNMKKRIIAMLVTMAITVGFTGCQQAEPKVEQNGSEATQSAPATTTVSENATDKTSQTSSELSETIATESASETEVTTAEITEALPIETTVTAAPIQTEPPKQTEPSYTQPQTPAPTPAPTEAPVTKPVKTEAPVTTTTTVTTTKPVETTYSENSPEYYVDYGLKYAKSIGLTIVDKSETSSAWGAYEIPDSPEGIKEYIRNRLDTFKYHHLQYVSISAERAPIDEWDHPMFGNWIVNIQCKAEDYSLYTPEYFVNFGKEYAQSIGLQLDDTAIYCWDTPIGFYTLDHYPEYTIRDIISALNYYKRIGMTYVWIWAQPAIDYHGELIEGEWELYIGYA